MLDRRTSVRARTYLGGQIAFNNRFSTMDCLVRNMSHDGAKIELASTVIVPGKFDITINQRGDSRRAQIVWRTQTEAGITFLAAEGASVISIQSARQIKHLERVRASLEMRVAQLCEPA